MSRIHTPITDELANYIREVTLREPEALRRVREETEDHPHASMQTCPSRAGSCTMARVAKARKTLEVESSWGYSSTWVALGAPAYAGKIIARDTSEEYTTRAAHLAREAGVEDRIDPGLALALETLDGLLAGDRQALSISPSSTPTRATTPTITSALALLRRAIRN